MMVRKVVHLVAIVPWALVVDIVRRIMNVGTFGRFLIVQVILLVVQVTALIVYALRKQ